MVVVLLVVNDVLVNKGLNGHDVEFESVTMSHSGSEDGQGSEEAIAWTVRSFSMSHFNKMPLFVSELLAVTTGNLSGERRFPQEQSALTDP